MEEQGTRETTIAVEGMQCESCAERLQGRLKQVPGVRVAAVSFAQHKARVLYEPSAIAERRLIDEVEKAGFQVAEEATDARTRGLRRGEFGEDGGFSVSGWKATVLSVPAILASLIPTVTCPLCITAYTALLSALGLGFLMSSKYLLPLTALLLAVAVAALAYEAVKRGAWGPLMLSLCGSAAILGGKFVFTSESATYGGGGASTGRFDLEPRASREDAPKRFGKGGWRRLR